MVKTFPLRVEIIPASVAIAGLLGIVAACDSEQRPDKCVEKTPGFIEQGNKQVKHGEEWNCYPNGGWKMATTWNKGKESGLQTLWHENGMKYGEVTFVEGKAEGVWTTWYANGQKASELPFKDGKRDGTDIVWFEGGAKKCETTYRAGEEISKECWNKDGTAKVDESTDIVQSQVEKEQTEQAEQADKAPQKMKVVGVMDQQSGHFLASPYGDKVTRDQKQGDVWGGLTGSTVGAAPPIESGSAESQGKDPSGAKSQAAGGDAGGGTIGIGHTGLIGSGDPYGTGANYGRGSGAGFGGKGKKTPRVRQAKAKVQGSLDPDIIRRIVRSHINEVRGCYNEGLSRNPYLSGRVAIQFVIGKTGFVANSVVSSNATKDKGLARCIANAIKSWRFPKPPGEGQVIVTYPFNLSPG